MADQPQKPGGFDVGKLSMGSKGLLISALALFIVLFFPWQDFGGGVDLPGVRVPGLTINGWSGVGILVGLLALAVIVWELLPLFGVNVQAGNLSHAFVGAALGGATALFGLIKFLTSLDAIAWGAFVGLIVVLVMGYASYVRFMESKKAAA